MTFDRRSFLTAVSLTALAATARIAFAAEPRRKLLVLVELKGGNDGLNTVIPYADPQYATLRPRLAIARDQVVALTESTGLHPSLAPLKALWDRKELAVVQGVGYPQPNLSHFRSIEIWDTASASDQYLEQGWLARAFALSPSPADFAADGVVVGPNAMGPLSGKGVRAIALSNPEQFLRNARLARDEGHAANSALAHILAVEHDVTLSAQRLHARRTFATQFPRSPFGNSTNTAAQLAANEAGIAVVRVSLGSFDTHANQLGTHANLLRQLAEGLVALRAALMEAGRWDSTVIATYAEFGRRPRENQSGGTDHGTAAAHLVLGGAVKGGLYGAPPALDRLDGNGNPPFAIDFRGYYATFLDRWWGIDSRAVMGE
ncbi:MAG TPA: DUF1501 domain-containing protein, partial [Usitatibacter sp.]|nr:DUF1501 domain-containing protein [Usitatibacter sp.]